MTPRPTWCHCQYQYVQTQSCWPSLSTLLGDTVTRDCCLGFCCHQNTFKSIHRGLEGNMRHATTWSLSVPAVSGVGVDALWQMSVCCGHSHVPGPHCQCTRQIERQTQEKLRQSKRPTTKDVADVERFVGMVKYMRKFSPHIIKLIQPLWELLKTEWVWYSLQQKDFVELCQELSLPTVLTQYNVNKETKCASGTSSSGLWARRGSHSKANLWRRVQSSAFHTAWCKRGTDMP